MAKIEIYPEPGTGRVAVADATTGRVEYVEVPNRVLSFEHVSVDPEESEIASHRVGGYVA